MRVHSPRAPLHRPDYLRAVEREVPRCTTIEAATFTGLASAPLLLQILEASLLRVWRHLKG